MRGMGSAFFAVWGYVISHMLPNRDYGTTVELNPSIMGFLIGEEESVVAEQLRKMCAPDLKSRSKKEDGKKLVKVSEYTYRVVNGDYYRKIRNEQERREYQRKKQAEYRKKGKALPGENLNKRALERGDSQEQTDKSESTFFKDHEAPYRTVNDQI